MTQLTRPSKRQLTNSAGWVKIGATTVERNVSSNRHPSNREFPK